MARQGKIARLPFEVREEINRRLLDNESGEKICGWINHTQGLRGAAAISAPNLSVWRSGGFKEWMEGQEKVERTKKLADYCLRLAKAGGGSMDLPAAIAGGQLMEVLEDFDPTELKALLKEKPETYLGVLGTLARLQTSKAGERKSMQGDVKLAQNERTLRLAEDKYQRETCRLYLKWREDKRAEEIALDRSLKPAVQVEKLRELMFGPVNEGILN